MTQADSAKALRRSLDSPEPGQGQARASVTDPLPDGWAFFCSKPDERNAPHWYATPPYSVNEVSSVYGPLANPLNRTVAAGTWAELHQRVAEQVELYSALTAGGTT